MRLEDRSLLCGVHFVTEVLGLDHMRQERDPEHSELQGCHRERPSLDRTSHYGALHPLGEVVSQRLLRQGPWW